MLDQVPYISQITKLLRDTSEFIKVAFNPKHKIKKEVRHLRDIDSNIKHFPDDLLENNYLSKENYNFMRPCERKPEVLQGLCKVHKNSGEPDGLSPLRPSLSAIGTCLYLLAKLFVPIFQ